MFFKVTDKGLEVYTGGNVNTYFYCSGDEEFYIDSGYIQIF